MTLTMIGESIEQGELTDHAHGVPSALSRWFANFSLMWFLWTGYLGSDRRNSHTSRKPTLGQLWNPGVFAAGTDEGNI